MAQVTTPQKFVESSGDIARRFKEVCDRDVSGQFTVVDASIRRMLTVHRGQPVFASSSDREERLNGILIRQGAVSLADLSRCMETMLRGNRRLGDVLLEEGLLEPPVLMGALRTQIREIMCAALSSPEGRWNFREQAVGRDGDIRFAVPVNALIREALWRTRGLHRILDEIGGPSTAYRLTDRAEEEVATAGLTPRQVDTLPLFAPHVTLAQICDRSTLADLDTCRLVWVLLTIGALSPVE